jgi:hypothetical protein
MRDLLQSTLASAALIVGATAVIGGAIYMPGLDNNTRAMYVLGALAVPSAVSLGGYFMGMTEAR